MREGWEGSDKELPRGLRGGIIWAGSERKGERREEWERDGEKEMWEGGVRDVGSRGEGEM